MKIIHINTYDQSGGAARAMWRLHSGLLAKKLNSRVLCIQKISNDATAELVVVESENKTLQALSQWGETQTFVNHKLAKRHCALFSMPVPGFDISNHPDILDADVLNIHWTVGFLSPESIAALQSIGKPMVWTLHDMRAFTGGCHFSDGCQGFKNDCEECPQLNPEINHIAGFNLRNLIKTVDASQINVVAPSRWLGECAQDSRFFRNSRVEVIHYGIDTQKYIRNNKSDILNNFGLEAGPLTFLFGADNLLEPRKGTRVLLEAMQKCLEIKKFSDAINSGRIRFLSFGGAGNHFKNMPWVKNLGRISDDNKICSAYSSADVFLCSTLEDNLPNTILESMSCGTPVIASRIGGIPDIISNGVNGWLFEVGDAGALAKQILESYKNRSTLKEAGAAARRTVEEHFALNMQADRYVNLYSELIIHKEKYVIKPKISSENNILKSNACRLDVSNSEFAHVSLNMFYNFPSDIEFEKLHSEILLLGSKINSIRGSLSWKITRPLRFIDNVIKKLVGKPYFISESYKAQEGISLNLIKFNKQLFFSEGASELKNKILLFEQKVVDMHTSLSWKITKPLRIIDNLIKKFQGKEYFHN